MKIKNLIRAIYFYFGNGLFMNQPFYKIRHWFLRKFLNVKIGKDTSIHMGCFISGGPDGAALEIGNNCVINRFVYLDGRFPLKIGNNVNISHYTIIQTLSHDPQSPHFAGVIGPVTIEDHVWIGARAIILPGVTLGEGCVIGSGAVVSKSIPPYSIAVGNPARVIKERNRDIQYKTVYFPYLNTDIQPQ